VVVDILGGCCDTELPPSGVCCRYSVDSCGVCGGTNTCGALVSLVAPLNASGALSAVNATRIAGLLGIGVNLIGAGTLGNSSGAGTGRRVGALPVHPTVSLLPRALGSSVRVRAMGGGDGADPCARTFCFLQRVRQRRS
jgi:hypothetical protein